MELRTKYLSASYKSMALKVYRVTDRIPIRIGEVTVKLGPLHQWQKQELSSFQLMDEGHQVEELAKANFYLIKASVKHVEGIEYATGGVFKCEFEDDTCSMLTDECANELLTTELKESLVVSCYAILNSIPKEICYPGTKKKVKDVEMLPVEAGPIKKK